MGLYCSLTVMELYCSQLLTLHYSHLTSLSLSGTHKVHAKGDLGEEGCHSLLTLKSVGLRDLSCDLNAHVLVGGDKLVLRLVVSPVTHAVHTHCQALRVTLPVTPAFLSCIYTLFFGNVKDIFTEKVRSSD